MTKKTPSVDPYKLFAEVYDQDAHAEVAAAYYRAVYERVDLRENEPVLDLGCGTGIVTEMLAKDGLTVIGVDRSLEMLALARKRCRRFGGRVRLVAADMTKMPKLPLAAAALTCGDVINHMPSRSIVKRVFRETRRCLQPGGVFVFETLNRFCFEQYWNQSYFMQSKSGDLVMNCTWDPKRDRGTAAMIGFAKKGKNTYAKSQWELTEQFYEHAEITADLRAAGFAKVLHEPWSPWPDQIHEPAMDRTLWRAIA